MKKLVALAVAAGLIWAAAHRPPAPDEDPLHKEDAVTAREEAPHYAVAPIEARWVAVRVANLIAQGDLLMAKEWIANIKEQLPGCLIASALAPTSERTYNEARAQLKRMVKGISANLRDISVSYVTDGPAVIMGEFAKGVKIPDAHGRPSDRFILVVALACPR